MAEKVPFREYVVDDDDHVVTQFVVCDTCHALVMDLFEGDWLKHAEWHKAIQTEAYNKGYDAAERDVAADTDVLLET